jgi:hypothetical protein
MLVSLGIGRLRDTGYTYEGGILFLLSISSFVALIAALALTRIAAADGERYEEVGGAAPMSLNQEEEEDGVDDPGMPFDDENLRPTSV